MYQNDRDAYRQAFANTWQKYLKKLPLETVESDMVAVILLHPEYHVLLENRNENHTDFMLEENPYLHMSLHMAIREQVRMNRPAGIHAIYENLMTRHENTHDVEHHMMTILANLLWQAQETRTMASEEVYLERLRGV